MPRLAPRPLQELVKEDPGEAIARCESGRYASSEACFKEYVKALVMTNKLDKVDLLRSAQHSTEAIGMP